MSTCVLALTSLVWLLVMAPDATSASDETMETHCIHRDEFETRLNQLEQHLKTETNAEMTSQLQARQRLEQEVATLRAEVKQLKQSNHEMKLAIHKLTGLQQRESDLPIQSVDLIGKEATSLTGTAFTVTLSHWLPPIQAGDKIYFDNIGSDMGNDYDRTTGTFTVRVAGWYVLNLAVAVSSGEQDLQIRVDGVEKVRCWTHSGINLKTVTQVGVFPLRVGSEVWVQAPANDTLPGHVMGGDSTRFTAFLLYPDSTLN